MWDVRRVSSLEICYLSVPGFGLRVLERFPQEVLGGSWDLVSKVIST